MLDNEKAETFCLSVKGMSAFIVEDGIEEIIGSGFGSETDSITFIIGLTSSVVLA